MSSSASASKTIPWILSLLVAGVAVVAWGEGFGWHFSSLNTYLVFPLLGLIAFSVMWSHYTTNFLKSIFSWEVPPSYFRLTSYVVLFCILMHPGLLAYQLWLDSGQLPPMSELNYVTSDLRVYIFLAMTTWIAFLSFELYRWFKDRDWFAWIDFASDIAMLLIIIHSLFLGSTLQQGWFMIVWYGYAVTLVMFLLKKYWDMITTGRSFTKDL